MNKDQIFREKILNFPFNSFYVQYNSHTYLVTKHGYAHNKIIKIYAKQLCGNDVVSGNYFTTIAKGLLKPCEMSDKKVIDFVLHCQLKEDHA
ncbi:MAG: peptide methionine sulfoxide reductase [Campylobacterota bacterium]|nr:peptide methionine sulfoxide reductase [Campylobacterota bacterium]